MKKIAVMVILVEVCLVVAGAAYAAEVSGTVTALDAAKNTITVKGEKMEATIDCETGGSMLKGIKVGDKVLYGKYSGTEVTMDGDELLIMRESDVFAIMPK